MRAATKFEYAELVKFVRKTLGELGYAYLKNETKRITEFEIESPCRFRVLVEDCTREGTGRLSLGSDKTESAIELWKQIAADEPDDVLERHVDSFLRKLMATLPREPWKGFGPFRSRSERVRWSELGNL
jgi:predicted Fe-S protein YdhL (DUF1289 family)